MSNKGRRRDMGVEVGRALVFAFSVDLFLDDPLLLKLAYLFYLSLVFVFLIDDYNWT